MDWGSPFFVLGIIAISTLGWVATSWIRARHGYPVENEWGGMTHPQDSQAKRKIELLEKENDALRGTVDKLVERISNLERIATDPKKRLTDEIEALR